MHHPDPNVSPRQGDSQAVRDFEERQSESDGVEDGRLFVQVVEVLGGPVAMARDLLFEFGSRARDRSEQERDWIGRNEVAKTYVVGGIWTLYLEMSGRR